MNTRLRESRWRAALVGHETAGCDDSLARPTTTTTTQVRTMPPNPRVTRCIPRAQAPRTTRRRARPTVSPPAPPVCRCPAPLRGFRPTTSPRQRQAAARYAHARHPPAGASTRAARTGRAEARVVCVSAASCRHGRSRKARSQFQNRTVHVLGSGTASGYSVPARSPGWPFVRGRCPLIGSF